MVKYKVVLTVKDRYGNTKEVDAGDIDIDLNKEEVDDIISSVKDHITVDSKSPVYVPDVTKDNMLKFTLTDEATDEELVFDIDKTNDWHETEDHTVGSSYVWERMQ